MKVLAVLAVLAAFAAFAAAAAPLLLGDASTAIPDNYIVVFKHVSKAARASHIKKVNAFGAKITAQYEIGNFTGYAAILRNNTLSAVLNAPEVAFVEADHVVTINQDQCEVQQPTPSWGLDRIAEQNIDFLDSRFPHDPSGGVEVNAYIIDTGVYQQHNDWSGRTEWGINYADTNNADCHGHGTHVAGTVAGTLYGVSKQAHLVAVKVLGCGGSGQWAWVISGIQWTVQQHQARGKPSVANLSLGGGFNAAVNAAVTAAVNAGVVMVIAAGNNNGDACLTSPASTPECISVGSTDIGSDPSGNNIDIRSSFSNFGTCTDIYAPGSLITSAWIGHPDATNTISGTSMAAPHVAGVVATILGRNPTATPIQVLQELTNTAGQDKITFNCPANPACQQSPNLLAYLGCAAK